MIKEVKSGIYYIENLITLDKYVGLAIDIKRRFEYHLRKLKKDKHENKYLQRAWNKYGEKNFIFKIIEEYPPKEEILKLMEIYFICYYNSFRDDGHGYNLTRGGDGLFGHIATPETREKMGNSGRGRKHTDETRKLMSENHADFKGENHPNYGKSMSDEQKKKISVANTGKVRTMEQREKLKGPNPLIAGINNYAFGKKRPRATSQYIWVRKTIYNSGKVRWRAGGSLNERIYISIGSFFTELEAALAYDEYIIKYNIDRPINFPENYPNRQLFKK